MTLRYEPPGPASINPKKRGGGSPPFNPGGRPGQIPGSPPFNPGGKPRPGPEYDQKRSGFPFDPGRIPPSEKPVPRPGTEYKSGMSAQRGTRTPFNQGMVSNPMFDNLFGGKDGGGSLSSLFGGKF